jgi:octaprenyl-diphosphate synthase
MANSSNGFAPFTSRLCYTLVENTLKSLEMELAEVKAIRFLCDYDWKPGKRLRPITFLLAHESIRVEHHREQAPNGRLSRLAAAIELMHEASLIHDDLVDRSELRRGVPTLQMANGQGLALLIGDYFVFRGLKLLLDVAKELANTGLSIAHGEADQLDRFMKQEDWAERMSMDHYLELIAKKTAAFFAGCAEGGAALGGADLNLRQVYRAFGMNMGIVFQMMDDLIDIFGSPGIAKKSLQNNLAEGTVTLPIIHAWDLYHDTAPMRRLASGAPIDERLQADLYKKFGSGEVLERSQKTINEFVGKTTEFLEQMPVNIYRSGLADLFDYVKDCSWGGLAPATSSAKKDKKHEGLN